MLNVYACNLNKRIYKSVNDIKLYLTNRQEKTKKNTNINSISSRM